MYQAGTLGREGIDSSGIERLEMRKDAELMIRKIIADVLPMKAVRKVLNEIELDKPVYVIAIGKAAWEMANETFRILGDRIQEGIVVTKYNHARGEIPGLRFWRADIPFRMKIPFGRRKPYLRWQTV